MPVSTSKSRFCSPQVVIYQKIHGIWAVMVNHHNIIVLHPLCKDVRHMHIKLYTQCSSTRSLCRVYSSPLTDKSQYRACLNCVYMVLTYLESCIIVSPYKWKGVGILVSELWPLQCGLTSHILKPRTSPRSAENSVVEQTGFSLFHPLWNLRTHVCTVCVWGKNSKGTTKF